MSALARFSSFPPRPPATPLRHLARGRGLRLILRTGLMALAAAGLLAGGLEAASGLLASRTTSGQALATAAAPSRWTEIRRPIALYGLAGTDFAKLPSTYGARRHEPDGAREDVMTFGRLGERTPYLHVSLLRAGLPAEEPEDGLADGLARLAGTQGLSATRIQAAAPVETRLGRFASADLLLWRAGTATPCLGFRGAASGGGAGSGSNVLRVAGFACGAPGRPLGRAALACALDRIDLVSAGEDAALRAVFVAAERRGGATCLATQTLASADGLMSSGRRLGWLDPDGDLPPLRGLFEAAARQR